MSIYPFIILKRKSQRVNKRLINHESIHLKQQLELLIIPFYIWYLIEFLIKYLKYGEFRTAYLNISFEREAYRNDHNPEYLTTRKFWAFIKYL